LEAVLEVTDRSEVLIEAVAVAALKAALLSLFIKSPGTTDDLEAALAPTDPAGGTIDPWIGAYLNYREKQPIRVDGATITHLLPDESVEAPNSTHPNSNCDRTRQRTRRNSTTVASSLTRCC
jgi:hypothetical protein